MQIKISMNGVDEVGSNLYIVHILLKFSGFSHFMEQISGLLQFGDLNALSGLELKANFYCGPEV